MKVYLAWNDGDYYGPTPVGCLVYASLEAAKSACVAAERGYCYGQDREWKEEREGTWRYGYSDYLIEEVEPHAELTPLPERKPRPEPRGTSMTLVHVGEAIRQAYTPKLIEEITKDSPLMKLLEKK